MKKRNYKVFILFALVLFLSVGYAVVNSVSLTVNGTASATTSDLKVYFNGTNTVSNSSKGTSSAISGSNTATFTASNMVLNESITFTYTVVNGESDVAANVSLISSGSNEYFTISSSIDDDTIQPGDTSIITVVVKMIKTPIDSSDNSVNFTITIDAVPAEVSKLITFTIDGVSYEAEKDMTWEQWVSSEYNNGSELYEIYDDRISLYYGSLVVENVGVPVSLTELIIYGCSYTTRIYI